MASKLYFDPPLWLQRQAWVLSKLRQEQVDSVVDIGCSNGTLLSALMQPAFQVDSFPTERFPRLKQSAATKQDEQDSEQLLPLRHWIYTPADILLSKIIGVDVDPKVLTTARSALSAHGQALSDTRPRWRTLQINLLEGQIEIENENLKQVDAFVATEVIEHLNAPALDQFAPTVLGKYRPRILLLTTPNYCFNENFGGFSTRPGFPDPTGRTDRVFRHDDHKFEWTPEEFRKWCETVADDYGYEVTIQGVGDGIYRRQAGENIPATQRRPRTSDNPDERLRNASQAAFFRRHSASPRGTGEEDAGYFAPGTSASFITGPSSVTGLRNVPVDTGRKLSNEAADQGDDEEDTRSRRARSRRPENLPFLSSPVPPSPQAGMGSSFSGMSLSSPTQAVPIKTPDIPVPLGRHQLLWDEKYACTSAVPGSGDASAISTQPLSTDAIVSLVVEKQRELFIERQWSDDVECQEEGAGGEPPGQAADAETRATLWDIWSDDGVRAACGGRIAVLLDALGLQAHDEQRGCNTTVVGASGDRWELRVVSRGRNDPSLQPVSEERPVIVPPAIDSDLWLVYINASEVSTWYERVREAQRWAPRQHHSKPWQCHQPKPNQPSKGWD